MECSATRPNAPLERVNIELLDSGLAVGTCSNGHNFTIALENMRFELLFQSGILALLDGHAGEAVLSITAALERFYEFYIKVVLIKQGVPEDQIDTAWKEVANQSERQYGAFCALYLIETGRPYKAPPDIVTFRNQVIHKGRIPTISEVESYAEKVFRVIESIIVEFRSINWEHIVKHLSRERMARNAGKRLWINPILSIHDDWEPDDNFAKRLEYFRKDKEFEDEALWRKRQEQDTNP